MKHILMTVLVIAGLLAGCRRSQPSGSEGRSNDRQRALTDTLIRLDSMVNANKVRNNQLSRELAGRAMKLATQSGSEEALARAYIMMGIAYRIYNNDTSYMYNKLAMNLAGRLNLQSIRISAMYNYASLCRDAADFKTAIIYYDSVIPFARNDGDYRLLSNTFNGIGSIKFESFDTAGARVMFDSAIQVADRYSLPLQKGVALASLARLENSPAENIFKLKEAAQLLKEIPGAEEESASIYTNLGMLSQDPDTALRYYDEALKLADTIHSSELSIAICNNKAYSYLDKKDFNNAEACLVSYAIPLAQQVKNYSWLASLYDTYTDVLVAAKRTDDALKYALLAYQTKRLDEATSGAKQVRLLTTLLDVKNKELMLANNERELRRKESHNRIILISFSVSSLVLAVLIFFIMWRLQRNRLRYQASMLRSAKKIIDAEDRERTRIGRDFHDLTGQKFSGLSSFLENQEFPDPGTKTVAIKMLEEIRMAVREMSHRMNRAWVERFTLEESLSGLCADCIRMAGLDLVFTAPEIYPEMQREAKTHLFRIVQELLANAMNHARDAKITLELSFKESAIVLRYNDNGPGFDKTAAIAQGTGISNIIERVILLGGRLSLDTRPGFGTDYGIEIPLNQEKVK
jgi:signal transduction histidine kinase